MFKLRKHIKEYRKILFKMRNFWIGVVLLLISLGAAFFEYYYPDLSAFFFFAGFIAIVATKYRIIGRLEERYKDDDETPPTSQP